MTRALAVLLLLAAPAHAGWAPSLAGAVVTADQDKCDKLLRRYQRACPTPSPSPVPSPAPTKPPPPLPCEGVGTLTMEPGKPRLLCFDVGAGVYPLVEVKTTNLGNTSCSELMMQLSSPTGAKSYSIGPQPGTVLPRALGKWYVWLQETWGGPDCHSYRFTVVK